METKIAMRVSLITIVVNVLLSAFKLFAGIVANSSAMISDAVHSASDVISTIVVMVGVNLSGKKSDHNHPYGHERLECIAAIVLSIMLFVTGIGIGYDGINKIVSGTIATIEIPGILALVAAISSILIKEWMFWFTLSAAKKINSGALMADAWHHRSDAMSSIGSFVGVLGARLGFPIFDPLASVAICFFIVKAAYDIMKDAFAKMIDQSCDQETIDNMKKTILSQDGVVELDYIKTRLFGSKIYVDIEIGADSKMSFEQVHNIAEKVHDIIEKEFPSVKHCMVHANPKRIVD